MREAAVALKRETQFDVANLPLQHLYNMTDVIQVAQVLAGKLFKRLHLEKEITINTLEDFEHLFERGTLNKPLILILDEFDNLPEPVIAGLVSFFRNIYHLRQNQTDKSSAEKDYLLHGIALIGVRAVLGVENVKASLFNIQRSLHIPNLTYDEVKELFNWYQQESEQAIDPVL